MTKTEAIERFRHEIRKRNKSLSTEEKYCYWIGRYAEWLRAHRDQGPGEWLSYLADPQVPGVNSVSASTQRNALNALAKFHQWVLERDMGKLDFKPSRQSRKIPDVLSHSECHAMFGQMSGIPQIQAQIMYGSGLRISEVLRLRIKDLDFDRHTLTVRCSKGEKDRITQMPRCLVDQLKEQIEKAEHYWNVDQREKNPPPELLPNCH